MDKRNKTSEQHQIDGTARPDRNIILSVDLLDKMPIPDKRLKLSKQATDLWFSYGNQLIYYRLLSFLDLIVFGRYCQMYDRCQRYRNDIEAKGETFITQSGYQTIRPCVTLLNTTEAAMLKIEDRFGMSPSSRIKMPIKKNDDQNEMLLYLNGQV